MPAITADNALSVLPFFGPLLIFVCFTTFMLARGLSQHDRRIELLEGRLATYSFKVAGATAPILSPLAIAAATRRPKESAQP